MQAIPVSCAKRHFRFLYFKLVTIVFAWILIVPAALGQEAAQPAPAGPRPLITQRVDEAQLTTLTGNTHPLARPEFDLGTAPATLPMQRMLLVLKRSPDQEYALRKLLDDQQDKAAASYHKWLTPEQYGQQFGPTDADMQTVAAWLQSHGFQVGSTKGRTVLEFSGSASQVQEAFHTTIHAYVVNGEQHWANASDPMIPTALTPAVAGVLTLHNFIKKPSIHFSGEPVSAKLVPGKTRPQVTFPAQNGEPAINALAPSDYAVIYNINPVYSSGINGDGVAIGVVGRSNIYAGGDDVQDFKNILGYASGNFGLILNGPDPGDLGGGEEAEATLDLTWSSSIGNGADVTLVVSATTNTTDGIDLSENYIIENNFADVMTESFSACELYATDAQLAGATAMAEQAAAQGITYFVSTGDDGAEGCDDPSVAPATNPISVNYLASTAFNVAVGGTVFNENGDPSKYWGSTAAPAETALSYIPEDVWNESSLSNGLWSSSGGASAGNLQSGVGTTGGVSKPSWQYGVTGIPADGVRDLPDVALTAASHDPYLLCLEGSCVPNSQGEFQVYFVSGTSAAAPSFAGIMTLVDEATGSTMGHRQGLANYYLYRLAGTTSSYPSQCNGSDTSTSPSSACIFNDVTVGSNVVPGEAGNDYQAGAGYDLATGLGSVNVANLVNEWNTVTFNPTSTSLTLNNGAVIQVTHGQPVSVSITVTPSSGSGIPTGDVELILYPTATVTASNEWTLGFFTLAGGTVNSVTEAIPGGDIGSVFAYYAGDSNYAPSSSSAVPVQVNPEPSTTTVSVLTANQSGQSIPFTNGPFGSFVYLRADVAGQSGYGYPTGTVTFSDSFGAIPGGNTFPLNGQGNTANPNGIFSFDTGTHAISASYSGDASFNASNTTQPQTFTITPGFFGTISSAQSTVLITAPGGSGATSISVSSSTGFSGTISLACTGLPSEAACRFVPATITANGTPSTTTAAITVTTTAATTTAAAVTRSPRPYLLTDWMIGMGLLFSVALVSGKQRRVRGACMLLMLTLVVVVPGCGGGGGGGGGNQGPPPNAGTPTGTYSIVVSATSGATVSYSGFLLVLQ